MRLHPFDNLPVSPQITKIIYRAVGEKGRTWWTGSNETNDLQQHFVGEFVANKDAKVDQDNCTWDLKLMELKCHKEIMIPRQMARRNQ